MAILNAMADFFSFPFSLLLSLFWCFFLLINLPYRAQFGLIFTETPLAWPPAYGDYKYGPPCPDLVYL